MRGTFAVLVLSLICLAGLYQPAPVVTVVYDVTTYGAVADGLVTSSGINTTAFMAATAAAANPAAPGAVYVPPSAKGFVVNNGAWIVSASNAVIRGEASMGSEDGSPTSLVIGHGAGDTLTVSGSGCLVQGLMFKPLTYGEQKVADAFLKVTNTQVTIRDLSMSDPCIGISLQLPSLQEGEFWIKDVLIGGSFGVAGIVVNAGDAAVRIGHVVMYCDDVQPPYGICVSSCGELVINDATDVINCGNCLALVPGMGGVKSQHVIATMVSDSLFDSGNGQGCVYVGPQSDGFVLNTRFCNVWTSTPDNNRGKNPTNGFTLDGSMARPVLPNVLPIQDVTLTNCLAKSFVNHCGVYAKNVNGLGIFNSTFGACYRGIQIAPGCPGFILSGNRCGAYVPSPGSFPAGNANYGILIEANDQFIVTGNLLYGNGTGGYVNLGPVTPRQVVGLNLQ